MRKAPPAYEDGVYMLNGKDRASPRRLSQLFMRGEDGLGSKSNRTAFLAFFGQVVSNEIVMASESGCPIEMFKIEIEKCDEAYDAECKGDKYIPFHRAAYDRETGQSPNAPREQINQVTSWIDGSFVYSTSETWLNAMRSFVNGTLLTEKGGTMPVRNTMRVPLFNNPIPHQMRMSNSEKLFCKLSFGGRLPMAQLNVFLLSSVLGDPRTNQNPALLSFAIVFLRWHNELARRIQIKHPTWSDEDVFQRARRIVVASLQNVIMYEYLPALLGTDMPTFNGHNSDVHPGISNMFGAAAFRFGHTLIPPGIYVRNAECDYRLTAAGYPALRLCSTWWNSNVNCLILRILRIEDSKFLFFPLVGCTFGRECRRDYYGHDFTNFRTRRCTTLLGCSGQTVWSDGILAPRFRRIECDAWP